MRSRKPSIVAAVIGLVVGGIAFAAPAPAAAPRSAGTAAVGDYDQLVNSTTHKCVDVLNRSKEIGARIHQWECVGGPQQHWAAEPAASGNIALRNLNSGLCMTGAIPFVNGAVVFQRECNPDNTNQWWHQDADGGFFKLSHPSSGKCLDLNRGSTANGTKIQLWDCSTASNAQDWYFV